MNKHSYIESVDEGNTRTTATKRRDSGLTAVVRTQRGKYTDFVLNRDGATLVFNGREAKTLLRLLSKHYED